MKHPKLHLILADDDMDDCEFFMEATDEISDDCKLTVVNDGVELMEFLSAENAELPNLIFLDLNMPRKSGMECIPEIKSTEKLAHIPIIVYSTSLDHTVVNELYQLGVLHYIQKPAEFANIKRVIEKALILLNDVNLSQRSREQFIIQP
ncbi:response regulator receiver domain-containing protein [Gelidibacter sediminis]|uniref:Response regulator receiver domain-containing protein n=1 Tax=Gelidibacter sediminis TaxID=1608710 RepID=A0A4R7Q7W4_9FLAO|nr:response regulator [Gelidibacter sediminis]TDU43658.1 response regulator receiver domain-containing protein [Gelidibacter sediminis]